MVITIVQHVVDSNGNIVATTITTQHNIMATQHCSNTITTLQQCNGTTIATQHHGNTITTTLQQHNGTTITTQ
jgi:hypothetical protein